MNAEQILKAMGVSSEKRDNPEYLKDVIVRLWNAILSEREADQKVFRYIRDTYAR